MTYLVVNKLYNGDYIVRNTETNERFQVDLFVDASCDFDPTEDILQKTIEISKMRPFSYTASGVKLLK